VYLAQDRQLINEGGGLCCFKKINFVYEKKEKKVNVVARVTYVERDNCSADFLVSELQT
jgi:hypothetical protein